MNGNKHLYKCWQRGFKCFQWSRGIYSKAPAEAVLRVTQKSLEIATGRDFDFSKISVKGKDIAPLYSYLTQKSENGVLDTKMMWNFQKFLISRNGTVIRFVSPSTSVNDAGVMSDIDKALAE